MSEYTIIDHVTGDQHELEHEDMADIQCALEFYFDHIHSRGPRKPIPRMVPNVECMQDTLEKLKKVRVSMTDY